MRAFAYASPVHRYVYDLTVPETLNFVLANGLGVRDSFHHAGVATKNVSSGVPRVKELISCSQKIKTPSLTIRLEQALANDSVRAGLFARSLARVYLKNVAETYELVCTPPSTVLEKIMMSTFGGGVSTTTTTFISTWSLVIALNRRQLSMHALSVENVADAISEFGNDRLFACGDEKSYTVTVRLLNLEKFIVDQNKLESLDVVSSHRDLLLKIERAVMQRVQSVLYNSVHICGLPSIKSASTRGVSISIVDAVSGNLQTKEEIFVDTDGTYESGRVGLIQRLQSSHPHFLTRACNRHRSRADSCDAPGRCKLDLLKRSPRSLRCSWYRGCEHVALQ